MHYCAPPIARHEFRGSFSASRLSLLLYVASESLFHVDDAQTEARAHEGCDAVFPGFCNTHTPSEGNQMREDVVSTVLVFRERGGA